MFFIQLSHGEPSWVPGSGVQSPVLSDTDLSTLAGQQDEESSFPGTPPDRREEWLPGRDIESRPVDLSGESDGVPSLQDGGEVNEPHSGMSSEFKVTENYAVNTATLFGK